MGLGYAEHHKVAVLEVEDRDSAEDNKVPEVEAVDFGLYWC